LNFYEFEKFEFLYNSSVRSCPEITEEQAVKILEEKGSQDRADNVIFDSLVTPDVTGIPINFLQLASRHFYLADILAGRGSERADVFSALAAYIPSIIQPDGRRVPSGPVTQETEAVPHVPAYLKSLDHKDEWKKALLIARACAVQDRHKFSTARTMAVANASIVIKNLGYRLKVINGQIKIPTKEAVKIVGKIEAGLGKIGAKFALTEIVFMARRIYKCNYDQILFGRNHLPGFGIRPPSPPIGLLFNLAIKQVFEWDRKSDIAKVWAETVELALNFCALLDVESYTIFENFNIDASSLEKKLREMALYDHLFFLRQWQLEFTASMLEVVFTHEYDDDLKRKFGWHIGDLISFCSIISEIATDLPKYFPISDLYSKGISCEVVNAILKDASFTIGNVNRGYTWPFKAVGHDAMFRPLLSIFNQQSWSILSPCRSTLGPAIYEVAFSAVKQVVSPHVLFDIRGNGTERLTRYIFSKRGFHPSIAGKTYCLNEGSGECDLVYEDDKEIILVECKAKALTRGSMVGVPSDAMLDFFGSLVASQAQSLQHERILRTLGHIRFEDGTVLEYKNRRITRLSISLTDQGSLQDRWMLSMCYQALVSIKLSSPPNYAKNKQVIGINKNLIRLQKETQALTEFGHDIRAHSLNVGSASVAQLDIIFNEIQSLSDVRNFMALPANYSTGNPLLQHYHQAELRKYTPSNTASSDQSLV